MNGIQSFIAFLILAVFGLYILSCNPDFSTGIRNTHAANIRVNKASIYVDNRSVRVSRYPKVRGGNRPNCLKWYRVSRGDTQWSLAQRFTSQKDKNQWLRSMRWISHKSVGDEDIKAGESVCVTWNHSN